ncbi:MAG TPA: hypothetical protein VET82_13430 [Candidatus Eisenbacteria bacterium]|nr:hypothetical protein [Candidatus Eisenbacteria bacterium]
MMPGTSRLGRTWRTLITALLAVVPVGLALPLSPVQASSNAAGCHLNAAGGAIQHVIALQFDNVHFRRDNPNVPSDIEQMPNLYNFLVGNGTVLNNHHTPLISHTGTDILTTLTGVYPDRHGQPVSNTFFFYDSNGIPHQALTFAYWTDLARAFDGTAENTLNMLDAHGKNPPAPWVPFTRAGCNFGAVGTANIELERVANVATVYGANSPEAQAAATNPEAQTTADFIGVAVHCSQQSPLCASAHRGVPDLLPDEPAGYSGFNGLFGHKYVAPQISAVLPMTDLDGTVINDGGYPGFPGFNGMSAAVSLSYIAAMQEHGVPITYAYLSAVHEQSDTGLGPGDPVYEQNLRNYDEAFGKFFARLAADGITKSNTLFVVTADENDHFVGVGPTNPGCDGVAVTCTYDPTRLGSVEVALDQLLKTQGVTVTITGNNVKGDSAPDYYLTGNPGPNDPLTRQVERAASRIMVRNPLTGQTEPLIDGLADRPTLRALHMVTSDPLRTPTFTQFNKPDYEGVTSDGQDCGTPGVDNVIQCQGVETWHHGDIQPQITTTWLGLVGPGVRNLGVSNTIWSDHTDTRPTIMALVGLRDDYRHDGRVLLDVLVPEAVPVAGDRAALVQLGHVYKQLDATVGAFGTAVVNADSRAAQTGTGPSDGTYLAFENQLNSLTNDRNRVALQISQLLDAASFDQAEVSTGAIASLVSRAQSILDRAQQLASND